MAKARMLDKEVISRRSAPEAPILLYREYQRTAWINQGSVYFINRVGTDEFKIGLAMNSGRRFAELQSKEKRRLVIACQVNTDNLRKLEEYLHNHFDDQRLAGEWFRLSDSDLQAIRQMEDGHWSDCLLDLVMAHYYGVSHHG